MKRLYTYLLGAVTTLTLLTACSDDKPGSLEPEPQPDETPDDTPIALDSGVYVLNGGSDASDPGSLTRINADGTATTRLFEKANGHIIGNRLRSMATYGDNIYFLCSTYKSKAYGEDTLLVVADARTMMEKKTYRFKDIHFAIPEGAKPDDEPFPSDPQGLFVLDESNIFITDEQGLIRFDSKADTTYLMEETFHIANFGSTLETRVSPKGRIHNGKLYLGMGGFWHKDPGLAEVERGKTGISRELTFELGGEYVPGGIVADADGNFWMNAFWTRRPGTSYFVKIDPREMKLLETVTINENLSPGYDATHGISIDGNYIYLMGVRQLNTEFYFQRDGLLKRFNLTTKRLEKLNNVFNDIAGAQIVSCNPIIDPKTHLLYVAVQDQDIQGLKTRNNLLIYDCSGEKPVLRHNIENQTSYVQYILVN